MGPYRSWLVLAIASVASIAMAHVTIGFESGDLVSGAGSAATHPAPGPAGTLLATAVLLVLSAVVGSRLRAITTRVPSSHGREDADPLADHLARYATRAGGVWGRLFVVSGVVFLLLEGSETMLSGASPIGLAQLLSAQLGVALPALASATLLVAATLALANWCHCALTKRLARRTPGSRPAGGSWEPTLHVADVPCLSTPRAGDSLGRSPPSTLRQPA